MMSKLLKYLLLSLGSIFCIACLLIFRPVPIIAEEHALTEKGIVASIHSNKGNDLIFKMKNTSRRFYINRGLELGLELKELENRLINQKVVMKYPDYWTPLDWNNQIKHISKLEHEGEVLFNEFRKPKK
jgi:hypothetical protein